MKVKRHQLQELIRLITKKVLKEYSSMSASLSTDDAEVDNAETPPADAMSDAEKARAEREKKHDINQKMKDTELKRKSEEADYKRNQMKIQQYRNATKPAIKREQDALKQSLRTI